MQTVLVISSDEALQADLHGVLLRMGRVAVQAVDRRGALRMLGKESPELAIICLDLAGGNALEVLLEIRLLTPTLPMLALAGQHRTAFEKRMHAALSFGANAALPKPVEPALLLETIDRMIASH